MFKKIFCFFFLAFLLNEIDGHASSLGNCPTVWPMIDFDINKLLGVWYVIQRTSTISTCIRYNFTKLEEPHHYNFEQVNLDFTPLKREYRYTGELFVPNPAVPAKMKIKFPLNETENASFVVFTTDYDHYAGIFTCQDIGHKQSAAILSRTTVLSNMYVNEIRERLEKDVTNPLNLSIISHVYCTKDNNGPDEFDVYSDDYTLSSHKMLGAFRSVRNAGEEDEDEDEDEHEDEVDSSEGIKKFSKASQAMSEALNKEVHGVKKMQNAHVHPTPIPIKTSQYITKTPSTESSRTIYTSFANDNE